ncbi:hypothetical protein SAMN04487764_0976 [Gillisia sp. Hel1_33_143]|nr:hypothetical protein SAMN04487764_0976 [Gillisia sp. Hel1_33_143]
MQHYYYNTIIIKKATLNKMAFLILKNLSILYLILTDQI